MWLFWKQMHSEFINLDPYLCVFNPTTPKSDTSLFHWMCQATSTLELGCDLYAIGVSPTMLSSYAAELDFFFFFKLWQGDWHAPLYERNGLVLSNVFTAETPRMSCTFLRNCQTGEYVCKCKYECLHEFSMERDWISKRTVFFLFNYCRFYVHFFRS